MVQDIRRLKAEENGRLDLLILFHFHHFHLVPAAAMRFVNVHAALAASLALEGKQLHRRQLIHTIMEIHHHAAADDEVTNQQDEDGSLFHVSCKDNGIPQFRA